MSDFYGARVRVGGATGMAGGGVTSGEVDAAIAAALDDLDIPTDVSDLTDTTGIIPPDPAAITVTTGLAFVIDGGGATITTGVKGDLQVPFAGTITGWTLLADQSGSISVGVWKDTYANYAPDSGDSLFSATITTATKNTASGLSHAVTAGDTIRFNVASVTSHQRVSVNLTMTRSVGP